MFSYRETHNNISVSYVFENEECPSIPNPVQTFEQCFSTYPEILDEIYKQNFTEPSPIQSQAWPILLKGGDLIGIAQTGTGDSSVPYGSILSLNEIFQSIIFLYIQNVGLTILIFCCYLFDSFYNYILLWE